MTVSNQQTEFTYTGNGVTVTFAYSCQVQKAGDLQVYVNGSAVTSGITKNGIGSLSGGSVTFSAPPASGAAVRLERVVVLERTTDYQQNGDFLARVVNPDFDRLWMALQQGAASEARSIRFPKTDINPVTELPSAAERANKLFGFDSSGAIFLSAPISGSAADLALTLFNPGGSNIVGFLQAGLLAQRRSLQDKCREQVSALDFFYYIETDYAPCIQRAYNYLVSRVGGTILLPFLDEGWQINTPLNFSNEWKPIILQGVGSTNIPRNRPNDPTFGTTLWGNTNGACVIDITGRHNFGLKDLTIDTFNETKCPTFSRIGVLGGRNTVSVDNQNHHFTNVTMFMRSTGDSALPSIGHYAYGTELGTYTNCWYFADVPAVYTKSLLYGVTSPYNTLLPDGVSATCNVFTGMNYITVSGLGPSIRLDNTYDNVYNGSYFLNDSVNQTFPAVLFSGTNYAPNFQGFQSEGHDTFFETTGSLLSAKIHGFHIGAVGGSAIGKFNNYGNIKDCKFEILEGGATVPYQAYVGTGTVNSGIRNTLFSMGDYGTINLLAGTGGVFRGLKFTSSSDNPVIVLTGGDGRFTYELNGEHRSAGILKTTDKLIVVKSAQPNNVGNAVFSVTLPNESLTGQVVVNYTLNSSSQQCVKTGQVVVSVARVAGSVMVAAVAESIPQQLAQAAGAETIAVTFAVSGVTGGATDPNYIFLTCQQNSNTFGTAFFRASVDSISASTTNANLTDAQHLLLGL